MEELWNFLREKTPITGHWELSGVVLEKPLKTYPNGFPKEIIEEFENKIGRKVLGNKVASGTAIIEELGEEKNILKQDIL